MSDRKLAIKALQKAQMEFETPKKDATNAYLHNKYASLKSCLKTLKPTLHRNGFALTQEGGKDEFGHFMETKFLHETGEFFSSKIYLELDKNNMQGIGSAVTYAKRYGLLSLAGMEPDENPDDDDANKASGTQPKKSSNEQKKLVPVKLSKEQQQAALDARPDPLLEPDIEF